MTISIIGTGLIGGSIALGLRESGFASRLLGVERSPGHATIALSLGLVDDIVSPEKCMAESEIVVAATPVDSLTRILPDLLDLARPGQTILDVGSTKIPVLESVKKHPNRARFVATHPMAGTEYSGPGAAVHGLFAGKCCVFCETCDSAPEAVAAARSLYESLDMRILELDGPAHDLHTAYVSHISHIASFALALTVLEKEKSEARIFELASGGFSSTVRLAKSNPDTWIPIFRQNRDNVLDVLDEFINTVSRFRTLLIKRDFDNFEKMIEHANDIKRIIG